MIYLAASFFLCSLVYSLAGLGGGSTYIALLILFEVPFDNVPVIALLCNIIVVIGGVYHFHKAGHLEWKLLLPFIFTSIPMAYICGSLRVEEKTLIYLLAISLLLAGMRMLFQEKKSGNPFHNIDTKKLWVLGVPIGAVLGGLAGLTGIGGGIFLAPTLHLLKWGTPKQIAATCSAFILLNSASGLVGQLGKQQDISYLYDFSWLFLMVLIGGQLGSRFSSGNAPQGLVRNVTACIILFVSVRLLLL